MISYGDMTWCGQVCGNMNCHRNFTPEEKERAASWGGEDFLLSMADLKTDECGYIKVTHAD